MSLSCTPADNRLFGLSVSPSPSRAAYSPLTVRREKRSQLPPMASVGLMVRPLMSSSTGRRTESGSELSGTNGPVFWTRVVPLKVTCVVRA